MKTPDTPFADDTPDLADLEARLRLTFAERAPTTIETAHAWDTLAPRLATLGMPSAPTVAPAAITTISRQPTERQEIPMIEARDEASYVADVADTTPVPASVTPPARRATRRRLSWRAMALTGLAAVLVVAALVGAGYGAAVYFGLPAPFTTHELQLIGDAHLYSAINQTQTQQGASVTIDKAYADQGATYIEYHSNGVTSATRDANDFIWASFDVTDQFGEEPTGGTTECLEGPGNGGAQRCLLSMGPFHPATGVSTLTLTITIHSMFVQKAGSAHMLTLHGDWRFHFTLPFHHKNLGSGGPDANPTKTSGK